MGLWGILYRVCHGLVRTCLKCRRGAGNSKWLTRQGYSCVEKCLGPFRSTSSVEAALWRSNGGTGLYPRLTALRRGQGDRIGLVPDLTARLSPPSHHQPVQPVMVVGERPDDGMILDQYPGFDLSISELCHALKTKLSQERDSRCVLTIAQPPYSIADLAPPDTAFLSHWSVSHNRRG